jgi:hypothetical protein
VSQGKKKRQTRKFEVPKMILPVDNGNAGGVLTLAANLMAERREREMGIAPLSAAGMKLYQRRAGNR